MKVLHVASFTGNIGDNANHLGMRSKLESTLGVKAEYTELEIRYCYRIYTGEHRWEFDDSFVEKANTHDLVIIGGGNFFEPWLDESATATTINITNERLKQISKPLVFFGVGFDIYKGLTPLNLSRFSCFIEQCISQENVFISFRNDGSLNNFRIAYPDRPDLWSAIDIVPDGGFFYSAKETVAPYMAGGKFWGINIASDMEALRFPGSIEGGLSWKGFLKEYAHFLQKKLESNPDLQLIFFPHIFKDILAVGEFLGYFDDRLCRDRIVVAPFACGWMACDHLFSLYQRCELVMGMRFHTNVCSIAMNIPAIPLVSYPKLKDLYEELDIPERIVMVNRAGFSNRLEGNIAFGNSQSVRNRNTLIINQLSEKIDSFFKRIASHLARSTHNPL